MITDPLTIIIAIVSLIVCIYGCANITRVFDAASGIVVMFPKVYFNYDVYVTRILPNGERFQQRFNNMYRTISGGNTTFKTLPVILLFWVVIALFIFDESKYTKVMIYTVIIPIAIHSFWALSILGVIRNLYCFNVTGEGIDPRYYENYNAYDELEKQELRKFRETKFSGHIVDNRMPLLRYDGTVNLS